MVPEMFSTWMVVTAAHLSAFTTNQSILHLEQENLMACKQYLTSVVKEKRRQQILKAGKGTPVVGKACLEAKEPMEGGEVVETGFDRPVQGVDSAGIRDELYRAEGKPSQVLVDRLSALCFREPGTPRVFTRGTAMLACELGQSAAH